MQAQHTQFTNTTNFWHLIMCTQYISLRMSVLKPCHVHYLQVSADNGCGRSNWTDMVYVNLTALFPPRGASTEDDPPYHS